ncbi:ABC transporter I family member 1-like [Chenopodium quinoa]|uniref:ABC transporter I family member 1-like n=1 Tax=Chenopodium quinoa TaxID=63459 RepID=UPI000B7980F1|nr:ABC transporter I family member 1-like [Chenopodium quinoa]
MICLCPLLSIFSLELFHAAPLFLSPPLKRTLTSPLKRLPSFLSSIEAFSEMSLRKAPLPRILINNASCMRNAQQILRHVNASVHDGGGLVLTGSNGSGKSTFLRMLAGFSKPSAGEILWNGHDITQSGVFHQYKLQLGWVSLKDAVKEKFTVLENIQWFELLEGKEGRSLPALELMGLGRLAKEKARMLSMGQRKRLQLARLLAIDRPIWLLDEPSVALDDDGVKLLEYIIAEHRKKGGIVFVATHLPIKIDDAMYLRLPPRFPRRMTLIDMLDRSDIA